MTTQDSAEYPPRSRRSSVGMTGALTDRAARCRELHRLKQENLAGRGELVPLP